MQKIGLTGNIGSGKSLVAKIFEQLQVPVFYADIEGKMVLEEAQVIYKIKAEFGDNIMAGTKLDRKKLALIVFADKAKLEFLNKIIHPAVRAKFTAWSEQKCDFPYIIYEAAILYESGHYHRMDKIIAVTASQELRIKRVMQRDKVSREEVEKRIAMQWPEDKKIALADFVIDNNESCLLIPQVLQIDQSIGEEF